MHQDETYNLYDRLRNMCIHPQIVKTDMLKITPDQLREQAWVARIRESARTRAPRHSCGPWSSNEAAKPEDRPN